MKEFVFTKLSGAGNDFILFDRRLNESLNLTAGSIRQICDRRFGIGADGVLIISDDPDYDFIMEYFNADGNIGSLCGNGARCIIKYAAGSGRISGKIAKFSCCDVEYTGELLDTELVKFNLNSPKDFKYNFKILAHSQLINAHYVDTGSPHVVINIKDVLSDVKNPGSKFTDIYSFPVFEIGKEIRYSKDFAPLGTNVNFIDIKEGKVFIRTYERGVEDETLACGTGSTAAALIAYVTHSLKPPVELITKSGEILIVDFTVENQKVKCLSLTGPAKEIFNGKILI